MKPQDTVAILTAPARASAWPQRWFGHRVAVLQRDAVEATVVTVK